MWGKLLGGLVGLAFFKIAGLILGVAIGHWFDRRSAAGVSKLQGFAHWRQQQTDADRLFMYSTFAVMGHIAKVDGQVTTAHIANANAFMQRLKLTAAQQTQAQQAFREGKDSNFPLHELLTQLKERFRWRPDLLQMFLEIQISTAFVDARLSGSEYALLQQISKGIGMSAIKLEYLLGRFAAESAFAQHASGQQSSRAYTTSSDESQLQAAYQLLGITASASESEIKKAYKKQMAQHHPDKLQAQGLPPEMMALATEKTQAIQAAYALIRAQRQL
jgi:DnaJ like chaperone protein